MQIPQDSLLDEGGPLGISDGSLQSSSHPSSPQTVVDRFEAVTRLFPERLAVRDDTHALTYAQLAELVRRLAEAAAAIVAARTGPVAVLLPHAAYFPAAILAVLAAGRGVVPLDANDPAERIALIAAHAGACAVVSAGRLAHEANQLFPDLPILDIEAVSPSQRNPDRPRPDDLAYIIYTSGSTGTPKGVYQNHRGLLHDVEHCTETQEISCEDRVALFNSPTAISGLRVCLSTLVNGASLDIIKARESTAAEVVRQVRGRGITIFRSVPTLFRHVAAALKDDEGLEQLRLVILGGDRVDWRDFELFERTCKPPARFGVHLGATECSTLYLEWYVDRSMPRTGLLPVGRTVPERKTVLLDDGGRLVRDGEVGEFVVSSRYLALGYWRDPDLTVQAFSSNPLDPEVRVFRTGDLGRRRPDGLFEHVGRKDDQIKLRGRRINLSEIESVLREHAAVQDAAVVVRNDKAGVPQSLGAYVEPASRSDELIQLDLRKVLAQRLPHYMVPVTYDVVGALPRLPNLKIDRVRLKELDAARHLEPRPAPAAQSYAHGGGASSTALARSLSRLWCEALHLESIDDDEDFFMLGGDSLRGVQLLEEVAEVYGVELPFDVLFDEGTSVAGMARVIDAMRLRIKLADGRTGSTAESAASGILALDELLSRLWVTSESWPGANVGAGIPIFALNPQGKLPPLFWCFNIAEEPKQTARALGPDRPIYAMRSMHNVVGDDRDKEKFLNAVARLYAEEILRLQQSGPYFIGGVCQGGPIAQSIARLLMGQGHLVSQLTLVEYEPKTAFPGRIALFFGAQSVVNPFKTSAPEDIWKRLHHEVVWDIVPGSHGELFQMPNITVFMDRFQARLAEAQASSQTRSLFGKRDLSQILSLIAPAAMRRWWSRLP